MILLTVAPLIGGSLSSYLSGPIKETYKRDFPPSWVFGPIWTILYLMMGYSSQIIFNKTNRIPIVYWIQLTLNLLWSPVYFKQRNIKLAKTIMVALIVSVILTYIEFRKIDKFASNLLVPYLLWLLYAYTLI